MPPIDLDPTDTIVAIATPPGRGGIGIVRLSGADAQKIVEPLLRLRSPLAAARVRFGHLIDLATSEPLDEVLATLFAAPNSYTGEDMVEIAAHGSPVLLDYIVRQSCARGARLAEPGEFTQRAFLNHRIDLTQAEAVHDLVQASTLAQARQAASQLGGSLSLALTPIKTQLIHLIAALEAGIDFAEDDIDTLPAAEITGQLTAILAPLQALAATFHSGRILREGLRLAIVGAPNAGKSSLFNRLLGHDRAIVTPQPGTTRDTLTESFSLGGIPIQLVDTAGIRPTPTDDAERQGIARTHATLAEADIILLVVDATQSAADKTLARINSPDSVIKIAVMNKSDLPCQIASLPPEIAELPTVRTSALTGQGIGDLVNTLQNALRIHPLEGQTARINTVRQHQAVASAVDHLLAARAATLAATPHEMILLDLHGALAALDQVTGATSGEEILKLIFSTFCIGK